MINKTAQIRKRLADGATTRQIAQELHVSLRDIQKVRQEMGIDLGAFDREKTQKEKELVVINREIAEAKKELSSWKNQVVAARQQWEEIEADTRKKKSDIQYVRRPVEVIYFPENFDEVKKYLEILSYKQISGLNEMVFQALNKAYLKLSKAGFKPTRGGEQMIDNKRTDVKSQTVDKKQLPNDETEKTKRKWTERSDGVIEMKNGEGKNIYIHPL